MSNLIPKANVSPSARGEAWKAALLSALVIPGAGQIYNRQWWKGLFIALLFLAASLAVLIPVTLAFVQYGIHLLDMGMTDPLSPGGIPTDYLKILSDRESTFITLILVCAVLYVYATVDAYHERLREMKRKSNREE